MSAHDLFVSACCLQNWWEHHTLWSRSHWLCKILLYSPWVAQCLTASDPKRGAEYLTFAASLKFPRWTKFPITRNGDDSWESSNFQSITFCEAQCRDWLREKICVNHQMSSCQRSPAKWETCYLLHPCSREAAVLSTLNHVAPFLFL